MSTARAAHSRQKVLYANLYLFSEIVLGAGWVCVVCRASALFVYAWHVLFYTKLIEQEIKDEVSED